VKNNDLHAQMERPEGLTLFIKIKRKNCYIKSDKKKEE
jgi:hypothetical protein